MRESAHNFGTGQSEDAADLQIREIISHVLHKIRKQKTREQVAQELTTLTGRRVSVPMLNDYTRRNKRDSRFPLALMPAFCEVTGDYSLLYFIAGDDFVEGEAQRVAEHARLEKHARSLLDLAQAINQTVDSFAPSRKRKPAGSRKV